MSDYYCHSRHSQHCNPNYYNHYNQVAGGAASGLLVASYELSGWPANAECGGDPDGR